MFYCHKCAFVLVFVILNDKLKYLTSLVNLSSCEVLFVSGSLLVTCFSIFCGRLLSILK